MQQLKFSHHTATHLRLYQFRLGMLSSCAKSGAVKAIFQKTNIFELNDFTIERKSCEGGEIA
jgi:hypothetical protein